MYVYFQAKNGFNDILSRCFIILKYCEQNNRILLLDTVNSQYNINFSDYFIFSHPKVICDYNKIKDILKDNEDSVYPNILQNKLSDVKQFVSKIIQKREIFFYQNTKLNLPPNGLNEKIVVYCDSGNGDGFKVFNNYIVPKPHVVEYCMNNYNKLSKPYLAIQVRNTDRQCDYENLYEDNRDTIHSFDTIYIATDDKKCIGFFKNKGLNAYNFINFPEGDNYLNIHYAKCKNHVEDMISDLFIITMSKLLLSNSKGGYINLVRNCWHRSKHIRRKFGL